MKTLRSILIATMVLPLVSFSQDSLVTRMAKSHSTTFMPSQKTFTGKGWDVLLAQIELSDFVLLGEEHFTNEIPFFTSAVTDRIGFDNFICEIDPYSAEIIEGKIKVLSGEQLKKYQADFGNVFAFYAMESEFDLLKRLVENNTSIFGIDQILMNADRLICNDLKAKTKSKAAKKIYETIEERSKKHFADFLQSPSKPMYLMTGDFEDQVGQLLALDISEEERKKVEALKLSAKIYKEQDHHLRVRLMKHNLMDIYGKWAGKKNLFKYGAGHLARNESFLKINDIGNLIENVADSRFQNSLHILVMGKTGSQASPFKGFPENAIDRNSFVYKALKPLYDATEGNAWHCIDLLPLRKAVERNDVVVNDVTLSRIIKGFDFVVVIPRVTAAKFAE